MICRTGCPLRPPFWLMCFTHICEPPTMGRAALLGGPLQWQMVATTTGLLARASRESDGPGATPPGGAGLGTAPAGGLAFGLVPPGVGPGRSLPVGGVLVEPGGRGAE